MQVNSPVIRPQVLKLRSVWKNEATDFTPWMASNEGISWLCQDLGIESLKVEGVEVDTDEGKRIDILAALPNGDSIVIENQFNAADHRHFHNIQHYAVSSNSNTVIWIAESFPSLYVKLIESINASDWIDIVGVVARVNSAGGPLPTLQFEVISASEEALERMKGDSDVEATVADNDALSSFYKDYFDQLKPALDSYLRGTTPHKRGTKKKWRSYAEWNFEKGAWMKWQICFNQQRGRPGEYRVSILFNHIEDEKNLERLNYIKQNKDSLLSGISVDFVEDWDSTVGCRGQKVHFKFPREVNYRNISPSDKIELVDWTKDLMRNITKNASNLDIKSCSGANTYSKNGVNNHLSIAP